VVIESSGEEHTSTKVSAEECQKVLGFNKAALLCSSCDDLSKFKVKNGNLYFSPLSYYLYIKK